MYTFGELLKGFRQREGMTQAQLATELGRSRNNVSDWERSQYLPETKDVVHEIALLLALPLGDEQQLMDALDGVALASRGGETTGEMSSSLTRARQRLARLPLDTVPGPAPLPSGSRIPFGSNPRFVGRGEAMRALAQVLKGSGEMLPITVAITGMGGVGKSSLASEFAHRYGTYFVGGLFWFNFADPAAIPTQVGASASSPALDLPTEVALLPLDDRVQRVRDAWQEPLPRLLIFDNCEDEGLLARWRPTSGACRVLVTSRWSDWSNSPGVEALPLRPLSRLESVALLSERRPDLLADAESGQVAGQIAAELGDLPLALHLAGSFLARYARVLTPAAYLAALRQPDQLKHPSLQGQGQREEHSPTWHEPHLARTFDLSYERLRPSHPTDALALALLEQASWLARGLPIPHDLVMALADGTPGDGTTPFEVEDALLRLIGLGLVEGGVEGAIRLHHVVVAFLRSKPNAAAAQERVEQRLLARMEAANVTGSPAPLLPWQPHLRAVTDAALARADDWARRLSAALGYHLLLASDFEGARQYIEIALTLLKELQSPLHPEVAHLLNCLGQLHRTRAEMTVARAYFDQALQVWQHNDAEGQPRPLDTAKTLRNLADWYHAMGDLPMARCYFERALELQEAALPAAPHEVIQTLNNLALLLMNQGELDAAGSILQRALRIQDFAGGHSLLGMAGSLKQLGLVRMEQGELEEARHHLERAMTIREKELGAKHPLTAASHNDLGSLYLRQGAGAAARTHLEQGLAIREEVFGPNNSALCLSLINIALLLQAEGDYAGARAHLERAHAIHEQTLLREQGELHSHHLTALILDCLGVLFYAEGALAEARAALEQAVAIRERKLGPTHFRTAESLYHLALVLCAQGEREPAQHHLEQACNIQQEVLGMDHPATRASRAAHKRLLARAGAMLPAHLGQSNEINLPPDGL